MKNHGKKVSLMLSALALAAFIGCDRGTPSEKAKAAAASGNAVTEAAGQAAVDAIQSPMDEARQAEGILQKSAEQTAAEIKKSTE